MHPATIVFLLFLISLGLNKNQQEYTLFCFTVAFLISGVIGGICRSEQVANTIFWILFVVLITIPQMENVYRAIFKHIKELITYLLK